MPDATENESMNDDIEARLERLERRAGEGRWWRRATLALLMVGVSVPFAVDALGPVPNFFASGEVISASAMNENFAYLQTAITNVESRALADTCAADEIFRFDGTSWVCSSEASLTGGPTPLTGGRMADNIVVTDGQVSLDPDPEVNTLTSRVVDLPPTIAWNNSNPNGVLEMTTFANEGTCNETVRGRIRIWQHNNIGHSMDQGDSLCFCQRYVDRTPEVHVTTYRWNCFYQQSDGN
jgi:hypothetical protein